MIGNAGMLILLAAAQIQSSPDLGKVGATCRNGEAGPAFLVQAEGLRDRTGLLKLELYPATDKDFLADDNILIAAGKPFRRIEMRIPPTGPVVLCIRAPARGRYALSLLHDRDGNHRFNISTDGVGFAGNPKLGWSKPRAMTASAVAGAGVTRLAITLNYRHGLWLRPDR